MALTSPKPLNGEWASLPPWVSEVHDKVNGLLAPPLLVLRQSVAQSAAQFAWPGLNFDVEEIGLSGWHSTTTNPSRLTPTAPCKLYVIGSASFVSNATGARGVRIAKNGSALPGRAVFGPATNGDVWGDQAHGFVVCNGTTDYVEVQGFQSGVATLNTNNAADVCCSMQVWKISD